MSPKPSQVPPPNFAAMADKGKKYLTGIMDETMETLNTGFYMNSKGEKVTLHLGPSRDSLYCQTKSGGVYERPGSHQTQITLVNGDFLTVAGECARRGANPVVIDAASDGHFGGGYKTGHRAQEENFCRRSGLCKAVDPNEGAKANYYPLTSKERGHHAVLYANQVPVFRGEEKDGNPYLDDPFEVAVLVTAGYNFNEEHQLKKDVQPQDVKKLIPDSKSGEPRLPPAEALETMQKLRTCLHLAQKKGHEVVVLMPLYCGAFRNPPKQICEMLMDLITKEFPHSFREIYFSIIDDHNSNNNYAVFKDTIENGYVKNNALNNIGATYLVRT